jgi:hypothetical protein
MTERDKGMLMSMGLVGLLLLGIWSANNGNENASSDTSPLSIQD